MTKRSLVLITSLAILIFLTSFTAVFAQTPGVSNEKTGGYSNPDQYFKEHPERLGTKTPPNIIQQIFRTTYVAPTQSDLDYLARQRAENLLKKPEFSHAKEALVNSGKATIDSKGGFHLKESVTESDLQWADRRLATVLQKEVRQNRQNISILGGITQHLSGAARTDRWWLWILSIIVAVLLLDRMLYWTTGRGLFSRLRRRPAYS